MDVGAGDDARVTKARETIIAATIGLIIVVAAYAITNLVVDRIILKNTGDDLDEVWNTEFKPGNNLGSSPLMCCITPTTKGDAFNYFAKPSMMHFVTDAQCEKEAKDRVYNENFQAEKGTYWDLYSSVNDTVKCQKILSCWPLNGPLKDGQCVANILEQ